MNVKVEVELLDAVERRRFEMFVMKLEDRRALTAVERHEADLAEANPPAEDALFTGDSPIVAPPAPEPKPITDAELEAAITDCWKRRGLPAAKNVLALFGVERVGAIPAEKRAEALLEMQA